MDAYPTEPLRGVRVEDLRWLSGWWLGTVADESVEEVWTQPNGGTMIGMFRWLRDGKPRFYEAIALEPEEDGVVMRYKHLTPGPGLRSWEDQNEATEFVLTEHRESYAVFAQKDKEGVWLRYEAKDNRLTVAFAATGKPPVAAPFLYTRGE